MTLTPGMAKAWWAEGMMSVRNSTRLSEQLAKAHAFSHLEANTTRQTRDDVVIDSPTTNNHYPPPNPWPWIALTAAILTGAGLAGWSLVSRPAPPAPAPVIQPMPAPAPPAPAPAPVPLPGQPVTRSWLEFYRP